MAVIPAVKAAVVSRATSYMVYSRSIWLSSVCCPWRWMWISVGFMSFSATVNTDAKKRAAARSVYPFWASLFIFNLSLFCDLYLFDDYYCSMFVEDDCPELVVDVYGESLYYGVVGVWYFGDYSVDAEWCVVDFG